jgi:cytochrome P450
MFIPSASNASKVSVLKATYPSENELIRMPDYDAGADRAGNFRPLLGHGILALDGREWTRSRAMLRYGRFLPGPFVCLPLPS